MLCLPEAALILSADGPGHHRTFTIEASPVYGDRKSYRKEHPSLSCSSAPQIQPLGSCSWGAVPPRPTPPPWHADLSSLKLNGPQKSSQGRPIWRRELFGLLNSSLRVRHTQGTRNPFFTTRLKVTGVRIREELQLLPNYSPLALRAASPPPSPSSSPTPKWTSAHPQAL